MSFSVATNRKWKNVKTWETQENAQFHNVVFWNKLAEDFAVLAKKWQKVYISWRVITRSWDAPDWEKKYTTEIIWDTARVLWFRINIWDSIKSISSSNDDSIWDVEIPEIEYSTDLKPDDLPF